MIFIKTFVLKKKNKKEHSYLKWRKLNSAHCEGFFFHRCGFCFFLFDLHTESFCAITLLRSSVRLKSTKMSPYIVIPFGFSVRSDNNTYNWRGRRNLGLSILHLDANVSPFSPYPIPRCREPLEYSFRERKFKICRETSVVREIQNSIFW